MFTTCLHERVNKAGEGFDIFIERERFPIRAEGQVGDYSGALSTAAPGYTGRQKCMSFRTVRVQYRPRLP